MAYREIEESEVAIDAPITNSLMTALRDNLTAIVEGQATAPTTTTHSKSSVINKACFSRGEPSAGTYIIAETTGHCNDDDTDVASIVIETKGIYRFVCNSKISVTERKGDALPPNTLATVTLKQNNTTRSTANINSFITSVTISSTDDAGAETIYTLPTQSAKISKDIPCEAGDVIHVDVDGTSAGTAKAQVSVTLSVGVADSNTMYGVDARSILT